MYNPLKKSSIALLCACAAALSACSMTPTYQQPLAQIAPEFAYANQAAGRSATDLGWQEYFADARLRQLIALALNNNKDLQIATLNVEAVRAQYAIARADRLPSLGASASGNRARVAQDLSPTGRSYIAESYTVGLGVTAFELDLFGRVKSQSEAALKRYFAQEQVRDSVQMSLVAAVAKAYFAERVAQSGMDLSARVLQSREESKRLTDLKFTAGVISAIDVRVAETQIESARADYAAAERQREQARNALTLLIGQPVPADLPKGQTLSAQFQASELPVGLASDVLLQRPDVREAEWALQAANADIGAARAAFFPRIGLTASMGSGSSELNGLFGAGNATWSFVPQITLPIFTWKQNQAQLDLAQVRKNIAVARYEQTIQAAFRDIADALVARSTLQRQYQAQKRSEQASAERYRLVQMRFKHGVSNSLELLDAERSHYMAQQALLQTQLNLLENRADVYKALGGGLVSKNLATNTNDAPE